MVVDMLNGKWHIPQGEEFAAISGPTRERVREFNALGGTDRARADELLTQILQDGSAIPEVFAPFFIDYGKHTTFGENCFINANMTILDSAHVTVGANTLFGPNCSLITVGHPIEDAEKRREGWEQAFPITIGEDCWFGANVTVLPGVTVGDRVVAGAGAVITKDVPSDSLVLGVPARVVKRFV